VVTVLVLPFQSLGDAAEFFDGTRTAEVDRPVDGIDVKLLTRLKLEGFANLFGDDDLELGRDFDGFHCDSSYDGILIDHDVIIPI
jgi:hypothetical protein